MAVGKVLCFYCREPIVDEEPVMGPLCGPAEDHPGCMKRVWHAGCRAGWLRSLDMWGEVAGVERPRLRVVRDE